MMWRTTTVRGTTIFLLMLVSAEVSACCRCKVRPPAGGSAGAVAPPGDTIVHPIRIDSVEVDDERYAARPMSLGGRLGGPAYTTDTTRPTPGLPAPLDSMRDSALVAYLNSLRYDGSTKNTDLKYVTCVRTTGPCYPGGDSAAIMYIQPEIGIRHVKYDSVPPNGMIVARIVNYGIDTLGRDITVGLPGGQRGWWVVEHIPFGLRTRFFVRTYSAFPAVRILEGVPGPVHSYAQCMHARAPSARPSMAKWATCATSPYHWSTLRSESAPGAPAASELASYIHTVSFRRDVEATTYVRLDGGWSTCSQVCCAT